MTNSMWGGLAIVGGQVAAGVVGVPVVPDASEGEQDLARTVQRQGFWAKAYGCWGGANGSAPVRAANRVLAALSPATLSFSRSFRVVARKPA